MTTFDTLGLAEPVRRGVTAAGYASPTPIQAATIPLALAGRDLIGCAQTGTGKTAAFVLPLLDRLSRTPAAGQRPVRALVVTPTRELAVQVEDALRGYGQFTGLRSVAVFGGVGFAPQAAAFRRGVDVVVATPGRLIDHLQQGTVRLDAVELLVLDEADRMFDMGFLPALRQIVKAVPTARQTLLFSATMPPEIERLAATILLNPERIQVGERSNPAATVAQRVVSVPQTQKLDLLLHLLKTEPAPRVLVFTRTKHRADRVAKKLAQQGFASAAIHGNRSQAQRQKALDGFKAGKIAVLVATDVAARGIDVDGLGRVVNFDVPNVPEDYIHRIGRTGRAEMTGEAVTFFSRDEEGDLRAIERHIGRGLERKAPVGFVPSADPEPVEDPNRPPLPHRGGQRSGRPQGSGRPQPQGAGRPQSGRPRSAR